MSRNFKMDKTQRRDAIQSLLRQHPCLTDGDLAEKFSVSRATIRLDRQALGIPQMRDRMEHLVAGSPEARGLQILDKDIGIKGVGLFQTSDEMADNLGVVAAENYMAQLLHLLSRWPVCLSLRRRSEISNIRSLSSPARRLS